MQGNRRVLWGAVATILAAATCAGWTQQPVGQVTDTSRIGPDGTAYVTRVVPVPKTVSEEAQRMLARPVPDTATKFDLAARRSTTDVWQAGAGQQFLKLYPADVRDATMGGVPVRVITPPNVPQAHRRWVLLNLHGGGFDSDSGSLTESVPVAGLCRATVVAALYRLAPEHPFPAAVDDAVAVYRELLKTHQPGEIAIFGTSAGAILTAEVAARLKQTGLPQPAALGIFSGMGDFSRIGDSVALYALRGFSGHLDVPKLPESGTSPYAGKTPLSDPVLSPVFSDLRGLPPALFLTSGRDLLLSGTTILHRRFLQAKVDARLVVFEALPHAFWNDPTLPETREAHELMASFFLQRLGAAATAAKK